ncbi:hypothetical protein Daus18300_001360 [Diaporthe australafricana]|uniref:von Willebrand domain-containing protein n=1 Tax=Diaporthe australafricana TaxID=127596 RepID=A0ABR3XXL2_9PEZI
MAMTLPRLSSGVFFNMVVDSVNNQQNHIPEYPIFPRHGGSGDGRGPGLGRSPRYDDWTACGTSQPPIYKRFHTTAHPVNLAVVDRDLHRPPSPPTPPSPTLELCLPLLSVSIDMQVDCNIAKTRLVQTFTNHGGITIPEAFYSFPLYDGAAVTAFRCEIGDDKVLEGKVRPKDEAKREFDRAIKKQEAAGLVEEMAPDVFQTTIGNIKPRTTIKVEITYVEELHTDLGGDGIVVTIPTSVAPRYGSSPAGYATNSAVTETGLSLVVSIASPGPISKVDCRSGHRISVESGKMNHVPEAASFEALAGLQSPADSNFNPKHATACLSNNQTAMDRDIVLFIGSSDDTLLKSRVLLAPPSGSDHAAMMVTVRPSELFSDLQESMDEFDGEVLFLADRSGSMYGPKTEALKDALLVFLKSLPEKCKFNLYSFGSTVSSLWPHSMPYSESTVEEALAHVSTFQADFGGTEVLAALEKAAGGRRSKDVSSTQLILLTDGEIWRPEETIDFVRKTTAGAESRVRFFSLGIGGQVSHQLIQGIGFFGCGFGEAVAVDAQGKWKEAVIRMLKGAVMPTSWSYSIGFDEEWAEKRLDVDDFLPQDSERTVSEALEADSNTSEVANRQPRHVANVQKVSTKSKLSKWLAGGSSHDGSHLSEKKEPGKSTLMKNMSAGRNAGTVKSSFVQAPRTIPWLHHFGQQSVYFLLNPASDKLPERVTVTARSQYGGTKTATLAVTEAASNNNTIQHLAAKAAVRDLETQDTSGASSPDQIRKNAEQLCQMYSITSKWTSFVAVSHLQQSAESEDVEVNLYKAPLAELDLLTRPGVSQAGHSVISNLCEGIERRLDSTHERQSRPVRAHQQERQRSDEIPQYCASPWASYSAVGDSAVVSDLNQRRSSFATARYAPPPPANCCVGPWSSNQSMVRASAQSEIVTRGSRLRSHSPPQAQDMYPQSPSSPMSRGSTSMTIGHSVVSTSSKGLTDDRHVEWQGMLREQRAGGLFHLDKILGQRVAQHFCHGTRRALRRWLESHMERVASGDEPEEGEAAGEMVRLLVDTVMALAYIRTHLDSGRALWDLLVQKAEAKLALRLDPAYRDKKDELSVMADSALAHAHFGRYAQPSNQGSWRKDGRGSGRCGVCDTQDEELPSSADHDDGPGRCSSSGCDVPMDQWDDFWSHVVEQGHIYSSCGAARDRYREAKAKARHDRQKKEGQQGAEGERNQDDKDDEDQSTILVETTESMMKTSIGGSQLDIPTLDKV